MPRSIIDGQRILLAIFLLAAQAGLSSCWEGMDDSGSGIPTASGFDVGVTRNLSCSCQLSLHQNRSCSLLMDFDNKMSECYSWNLDLHFIFGEADDIQNSTNSIIYEADDSLFLLRYQTNCTIVRSGIIATVMANRSLAYYYALMIDGQDNSTIVDDYAWKPVNLRECHVNQRTKGPNRGRHMEEFAEYYSIFEEAIECAKDVSKRYAWSMNSVERLQPADSKQYVLDFFINFGLVIILMKAILHFGRYIERRCCGRQEENPLDEHPSDEDVRRVSNV